MISCDLPRTQLARAAARTQTATRPHALQGRDNDVSLTSPVITRRTTTTCSAAMTTVAMTTTGVTKRAQVTAAEKDRVAGSRDRQLRGIQPALRIHRSVVHSMTISEVQRPQCSTDNFVEFNVRSSLSMTSTVP